MTSLLKPDFALHLDGEEAAPALAASVEGIRVYRSREAASAFELVLADPEGRLRDDDAIVGCRSVRIALGAPGALATVFDGEVTAWRTELERSGPEVLVLRGLDRSHRLMRGTKTRTFAAASPLDVARKIAADAGLTPVLDDGGIEPIRAFRFQANASDFAFLRELAELEGFSLWVDAKELHLERPRAPDHDAAELAWGVDLQTFLPVADFRKPLAEAQVSAWDADNKAPLAGKATTGDQLWSVPGGRPGIERVRFAGGKPKASAVGARVTSQAHADVAARALLTRAAQQFLTAEVECQGDPRLLPGAMVNLRGVSVYSGHYLVVEANHFWDAAGYHTIGYLARDKWGDSSNQALRPAKTPAPPPRPARPKPEPVVINLRWKPREDGRADLAGDVDLPGQDGREMELWLETRAAGGDFAEVARGAGVVQGGTAMAAVELAPVDASRLGSPRWAPAEGGGDREDGGEGVASVSAEGLDGVEVALVLERQRADGGWERVEEKRATVAGGRAEARFSLAHPGRGEAGRTSAQLLGSPRWQVAPGGNAGRGWLEVQAPDLEDGREVRLLVERLSPDGAWSLERTVLATVSAGRVHAPVDLPRPAGGAQRWRFRAEAVGDLGRAKLRFRAGIPVPDDPALTRVRGRLR